MFTFEQIKELVELVGRQRLHGLEIERSGFRLHIQGAAAPATAPQVVVAAAPAAMPSAGAAAVTASAPAGAAAVETAGGAEPSAAPAADHYVINSPIVGTFYAAPSPDAPPFVAPGDRIRKGQVLCIVEAMKIMNEIEADVDGTVVEVFCRNSQPVEYGEPLFAVRLA